MRVQIPQRPVAQLAQMGSVVSFEVNPHRHHENRPPPGILHGPSPHLRSVVPFSGRHQLIAVLVHPRHIPPVRPGDPMVAPESDIRTVLREQRPHPDRKRRLPGPSELRILGFGQRGIALQEPLRHDEHPDTGPGLSEEPRRNPRQPAPQRRQLHHMPALVHSQLFEPRFGIHLSGRRRSHQLHPLGRPHHLAVRVEVFGVQQDRDALRRAGETVRDGRGDGVQKTGHRHRRRSIKIGVDELVGRSFDLPPPQTGRSATVIIELRLRDLRRPARQQHDEQKL